jgi:hypothetical protein
MFETLFIVIIIGAVIMACLFIYWIKYVYVEKDEKDMKGYSPLSQNMVEKNFINNNQTLYKIDPNFIKKRKNKKAE